MAALTANLDAMGFFPTTHAVLGAMVDKDLGPMLAKIGPLVDRWYFTDLPTPRAESAAGLQQKWNALQIVAGGAAPCPPACTRTLSRHCRRPSMPRSRLIESWSLARSTRWAAF